MFKPKYRITQKLLANIKRIAELTATANLKKPSKLVLVQMERSARAISSYSSTSIEGNPLPLTEVKKILKSAPKNIRDSEKEVLNYNNALEKLNEELIIKDTVFNLELVLSIQKEITTGLIEKHRCGKLRVEPVFVNDPRLKRPIYLPPDHQDGRKLINDLILFVSKNRGFVDPLILAGIFHKQFVIIHPFIDGNGRTSRLATKALLADMGLNTFNLFSFENYYNKNVSKYFEKVGVFGNYYDIKDKIDFTEWLEYFTDGIIDELLRVGKELEIAIKTPDIKLPEHLIKLLNYIEENGSITNKEYSKATKRSKASRNIDFAKLIKMELIAKFGKGKNTYYKIKHPIP